MRCDDCKAQPRQPGLNAAAAFGCCLRYAATVTRRNARRTIVWASLREVARRRRKGRWVKRDVLLCVLGPYAKLDRTYVCRVAVVDSIPPGVNRQLCRISNRRDYSTRLRRRYSSDSHGNVIFYQITFEINVWQTDLSYLKIFKQLLF